jgi:hypothetical protein
MTSVTQSDRRNLRDGSQLRDRFVLRVGGITLVEWLSQIELEVTSWLSRTGSNVRVTRLHHALRFALAGRIFAALRVDEDGLFFRQWKLDGSHQDHIGLDAELARALVKQFSTAA